ncbi:hypothetical protein BDW02DRAFT_545057 [Decorospora gaudefroyi]|uniref:Uncharacterized protein n=1 Tax=Decorospora gaudefroyi TaxID=184978 RepID=A0A6A5KLK9_9PLEO|nr:hypothetical protein BDW02DRAFT_545057 [Decorospora gaudefroyi]
MGQRVYVSGLAGSHELETGVAYYYRGHYLYACPAGTPIEPVPYSTKNRLNVVGVVVSRAPFYDPNAPGLVPENSLRALDCAIFQEAEWQKEQEEARKREIKESLEEEAAKVSSEREVEIPASVQENVQKPLSSRPPSHVPSSTTLLVPPQVPARMHSNPSLRLPSAPADSASVSVDNIPRIGTVHPPSLPDDDDQSDLGRSYTPHDRGHYLAYSAPGSRKASIDYTPLISHPSVSPTHGDVTVRSHDALLRPIASTSRLNQLLVQEGVRRAPHQAGEGPPRSYPQFSGWDEDRVASPSVQAAWLDQENIDAFVEKATQELIRLSVHPLSETQNPEPELTLPDNNKKKDKKKSEGIYLPGLGHPDVISATSHGSQNSTSTKRHGIISAGHPNYDTDSDDGHPQPPRPYSPGTPNYDSAESRAYLACLARQHAQKKPHASTQTDAAHTSSSNSGPPQKNTTGRPRAASRALNEAYNAANPTAGSPSNPSPPIGTPRSPKCSIHDERCDGTTVTELHRTQQAMLGAGFVEIYPMVKGLDGRTMVDWHVLCQEMGG